MEEQKYYTPAPEDLRIGLECEIRDQTPDWRKLIVTNKTCQWIFRHKDIYPNDIRVPYLTAAQVEEEGWKANGDQRDYVLGDKDEEHYTLHHSVAFNEVIINRISYDEETNSMRKQLIYFGNCRCINDLRLICKLLGI